MILCDREILELIDDGMITPAVRKSVGREEGVISYGPSPYGYDVRLGRHFRVYKNRESALDPLLVKEEDAIEFFADEFDIPGGGFVLGTTFEYVKMPSDVTAFPCDKSTYARLGISIKNTVVDAGFQGNVTLEIFNHQPFPIKLRAGHGIAQFIFHRGNACDIDYAKRNGKYMFQSSTTMPRI